MARLYDIGIYSVNATNGAVGSGYKLNFYITGTSTRKNTYPTRADAVAGTNANANPISAAADGRFGPIWLTGGDYKVVLTDLDDVVVETLDPGENGELAVSDIANAVQYRTSRSNLAAASTTPATAFLTESGREGTFVWSASDNSTNVTNDPNQGIYIAPTSDATGASGAWVRKYDGALNVKWFGAKGDDSTDDTVAIQAAIDFMSSDNVLYFPDGEYKCLSKLTIGEGTATNGRTFIGDMGGDLAVGNASTIYLHSSSADTVLFELDEASGTIFRGLSLKGKGSGVAGSYTFTASDDNADVDIEFHQCTLGYAETIGKITGRGLTVTDCNLLYCVHGFEIAWPGSFVTGGGTDQYTGSGARVYRIENNRCHAWSGGFLVQNLGANAHYTRGIVIKDNYADTPMRIFDGHANDVQIVGNEIFHTSGTATHLIEVRSDINTVGGVVNHKLSIVDNHIAGQYDTTYQTTSVSDLSFLGLADIANLDGLTIRGNIIDRTTANLIDLTTVTNYNISDNIFVNVCLQSARHLTLTSVSGVFTAGETVTGGTSGATGVVVYKSTGGTLYLNTVSGTFSVAETVTGGTSSATGTVSATSLLTRSPVRHAGGTCTNGYIGENHLITEHTGNAAPFVATASATVTGLKFGELFYDSAKWGRTDYLENPYTNVADDAVTTYILKKGNGMVAVQSITGSTMETAIISFKRTGTDSIELLTATAGPVFTVTTGVLAGTTGTDVRTNLSVVESGGVPTLYVENRRGGARDINVMELGV